MAALVLLERSSPLAKKQDCIAILWKFFFVE
jgi:hypothetical protein